MSGTTRQVGMGERWGCLQPGGGVLCCDARKTAWWQQGWVWELKRVGVVLRVQAHREQLQEHACAPGAALWACVPCPSNGLRSWHALLSGGTLQVSTHAPLGFPACCTCMLVAVCAQCTGRAALHKDLHESSAARQHARQRARPPTSPRRAPLPMHGLHARAASCLVAAPRLTVT